MALPNTDAPLAACSTGAYGSLRQKPNSNGLVFHFLPSLADELALARKAKGSDPNTQESAGFVRRAAVMLLPPREADAIALARGFRDIDPETLIS